MFKNIRITKLYYNQLDKLGIKEHLMANSKKYLNKLKNAELGIYLPYVESVVFEVEGLTSRTEMEMFKLKVKKYSQFFLFIALIFTMVIMPSFLITLANQTPSATIYEKAIYYGWTLFGLFSGATYFRSLKGKRKNINDEINTMKQAAYIAVKYAQNTMESFFNDKNEHIASNNIQIGKENIGNIDAALNRCEIDLTMFDRIAYNNDNYRNLRNSDKRRDPKAKKQSVLFLTEYLKQIQKPYKAAITKY